jgi:hypothetical protein
MTPDDEPRNLERHFQSRKDWCAVCDDGHAFWAGPVRHSPQQANADAQLHDNLMHANERTAVVMSVA